MRRHVSGIFVAMALLLAPMVHAAIPSSYWAATGSMNTARRGHTATVLATGKVLVVGGSDNSNVLATAELYDPVSGAWTATGSLHIARSSHTATLLPSGEVLVAGGMDGASASLSGAELYDPASGTWTATGSLNDARGFGFTATLLSSGKVLVAGGLLLGTSNGFLNSAEIYDPDSGVWTATGSLNIAREAHEATLLSSGKVLITGGCNNYCYTKLNSVEVYDPSAGTWATTGSMSTGRVLHTATRLLSGTVLVAGGYLGDGNFLAGAELYDPASGVWTATGSLHTARDQHVAIPLPSGAVLVAAGNYNGGPVAGPEHYYPSVYDSAVLASAEIFDPTRGIWVETSSLLTPRAGPTASLLPNGNVLVSGGLIDTPVLNTPLASAELYDVIFASGFELP